MSSISIKETLLFSWERYKQNPRLYSGIATVAVLIPQIVNYLPSFLFSLIHTSDYYLYILILSLVLSLLLIILTFYFTVSLIKIYLKIVDQHPVFFRDIFSVKTNEVLLYFAATFINNILVGLGLLLLIIPGVVLAIKYQFYPFFVIEKKLAPMDALQASDKITKGNIKILFRIAAVIAIIQLLSASFTLLESLKVVQLHGLGIVLTYTTQLVTVPIIGITQAYLFRKLSQPVTPNPTLSPTQNS